MTLALATRRYFLTFCRVVTLNFALRRHYFSEEGSESSCEEKHRIHQPNHNEVFPSHR